MTDVFIFQSNVRGMQYGMGTYIRTLSETISESKRYHIYHVCYLTSEIKEINIECKNNQYTLIQIPVPRECRLEQKIFEQRYASLVLRIVSQYVKNEEQTIFHFNSVDALYLLKKIKTAFKSPIISTAHFSRAQLMSDGNLTKTENIDLDNINANDWIARNLREEREYYKSVSHVITVCDDMREYLINRYKIVENKISLVRNGIVFPKNISTKGRLDLRKKYGFHPDDFILLYVGRIDRIKGLHWIIKAVEQLSSFMPNIRFIAAGQGDIENLIDKTKTSFGCISYTGFVNPQTVNELIRLADGGIILSLYDHCPYSILEMIALKLPMIVSRVTGNKEIFNDDECLYINPIIEADGSQNFNVKDIVHAIELLHNNKKDSTKKAQKIWKRARSEFSAQKMCDDTLSVYNRLLYHRTYNSCIEAR